MSGTPSTKIDLVDGLWSIARGLFGKQGVVALMLVGATVFVTVYATRALAEGVDGKVDAGVAPVARELAEHKAAEEQLHREGAGKVSQLEQRVHMVEISSLETSMNVQLLVKAQGLQPVALPRPPTPDGGTP